jgi:hypothetical protein
MPTPRYEDRPERPAPRHEDRLERPAPRHEDRLERPAPRHDDRPAAPSDDRTAQRVARPAPRVDPRSDDPPPRFDPRSEDRGPQRFPLGEAPGRAPPSQRGLAGAPPSAGARLRHDSPPPRPRAPAPPASRGARPSRPGSVDGALPVGSPPEIIGEAIAGRMRDAASRLLLAALRVHDEIGVRGAAVDACSPETLASFAPPAPAQPGQFEPSHAQEIVRWKGTFGPEAVDRIRAETAVCATFLAYATMLEADVPQNITLEVLQAACAAAFRHGKPPLGAIGRYMSPSEPSLAEELGAQLAHALGVPLDVPSVGYALGPVMTSIEADLVLCARLVKDASGL